MEGVLLPYIHCDLTSCVDWAHPSFYNGNTNFTIFTTHITIPSHFKYIYRCIFAYMLQNTGLLQKYDCFRENLKKNTLREMLGTLFIIHWVKLLQPFSQFTRYQQGFGYNNSFITIIQSHGCKEILNRKMHAKKIGEAVFLYVFNIGFPASLLSMA